MSSKEMKYHILRWMLYDKQFIAAATEYKNGSDAFGVNRSHFSTEVEIKVSWNDFMSEMKTIRYLLAPETDKGYINAKRLNKFDKHRSYLISEAKWCKRPRYFYFAVPLEMQEKAMEVMKKMSYGLLMVGKGYHNVTVIKESNRLSEQKFQDWINFCRKVTNENISLRDQINKLTILTPTSVL